MKKVVVHVYPLLWVYLVWQLLSVATGCSAALSVVISGSMEPQIKRGDLLFAVGPDRGDELRPGDIVLYRLPHRPEIPIVHRIIDVVPPSPQSTAAAPQPSLLEVQYLTKGDANKVDDRGLVAPSYPSGLVPKEAILGKVRGQVPWLGYLTILMQEIKYVVFAVIGLMVLRSILAADPRDQQQGEQRMPSSKREWAWFLLMPWS